MREPIAEIPLYLLSSHGEGFSRALRAIRTLRPFTEY